jgi:hypothetical protein
MVSRQIRPLLQMTNERKARYTQPNKPPKREAPSMRKTLNKVVVHLLVESSDKETHFPSNRRAHPMWAGIHGRSLPILRERKGLRIPPNKRPDLRAQGPSPASPNGPRKNSQFHLPAIETASATPPKYN